MTREAIGGRMMPPCKSSGGADCPRRAPGCQSHCERYAAYAAERERIRAARDREADARNAQINSTHKAIRRARSRNK